METVEQGEGNGWAEREVYWIAEFRKLGCDLTNHTNGGEGTPGYSPTPEWKAKNGERVRKTRTGVKFSASARANMSAGQKAAHQRRRAAGEVIKHKPRSEATLRLMSKVQKGRKASEATRKKMSESHKNPSLEMRAKLSEAVLKRPESEREKFAKNRKGATQSEESNRKRSEAMLAYWTVKKGGSSNS